MEPAYLTVCLDRHTHTPTHTHTHTSHPLQVCIHHILALLSTECMNIVGKYLSHLFLPDLYICNSLLHPHTPCVHSSVHMTTIY